MPAPIGGACLLADRALLARRWPGGEAALRGAGPLCGDGEVLRLRAESPGALVPALEALAAHGLWLAEDDDPGELAVVDARGFAWPSHLFELGIAAGADGAPVLAARRAGSALTEVAPAAPGEPPLPRPEPLPPTERPLRWLGRDRDADVFHDRFTGEQVRVARSTPPLPLVIASAAGERPVLAEQALGGLEQELGLMFRERLPAGLGMLFDFGRPGPRSFWMRNTLCPLDLLFLDAQGRVAALVEQARPLSLRRRGTRAPCRWVLEVEGGWCAALGVAPGDRVLREGGRPLD